MLTRNERYFRGRPAIEEVVFRPIPETATRLAELKTGGVDIVVGRQEGTAGPELRRGREHHNQPPVRREGYPGAHGGGSQGGGVRGVRQVDPAKEDCRSCSARWATVISMPCSR